MQIDAAQITDFRDAIFRHANGGNIPIRVFRDDGQDSAPVVTSFGPASGDIDPFIDAAAKAAASADPAVFCPPLCVTKPEATWRARETDLAAGVAISVELDDAPQRGLASIVQVLGQPTVVVASGGITEAGESKLHAHWRLMTPATGTEMQRLKWARAMATDIAGGDRTSVPISHPIRWPGSVHRKAEPRLAEIVAIDDSIEIDLVEALDRLQQVSDVPMPADRVTVVAEKLIAPQIHMVRAAVDTLQNPDDDWDGWNSNGLLIFAASGGSDEGRRIFHEYSFRSQKYDPVITDDRWAHYFASPPTKVGWEGLRDKTKVKPALVIEDLDEIRITIERMRGKKVAAPEPVDVDVRKLIRLQFNQDTLAEMEALYDLDVVEQDELLFFAEIIFEHAQGAEARERAAQVRKDREGQARPEFLERMPQGAARRLAEHALAVLDRPIPELAVMAALTGLSGVTTGYAAVTPANVTPLTIWTLALAPSGVGKSFVEAVVGQIVSASGLDVSNMPASRQGMHREFIGLSNRGRNPPGDGSSRTIPTMVVTQDEVGYWLQGLRQTGSPVSGVMQLMLSVYNRSVSGKIPAEVLADARNSRERVLSPAFVSSGFSTPDAFFDALEMGDVVRGYGNRTLIFAANYPAEKRGNLYVRPDRLPQDAVEAIRVLADGCYNPLGDKAGFYCGGPDHSSVRTLRLHDEDIMRIDQADTALMLDAAQFGPASVLANRFAENAIKIAGLLSVMEHASTAVVLDGWDEGQLWVRSEDVSYAIWFIEQMVRDSVALIRSRIDIAKDHQNAEKLVDAAARGLEAPHTVQRQGQRRYMEAGYVPVSYLMKRVKIGRVDMANALAIAVQSGMLLTVPQETAEEIGKNFTGPVPECYSLGEN